MGKSEEVRKEEALQWAGTVGPLGGIGKETNVLFLYQASALQSR